MKWIKAIIGNRTALNNEKNPLPYSAGCKSFRHEVEALKSMFDRLHLQQCIGLSKHLYQREVYQRIEGSWHICCFYFVNHFLSIFYGFQDNRSK